MDETIRSLPVLGICGCSGAGKTTLIEAVIPRLIKSGIRLVVIKHDAHNVCMDRKGKDSHRFYQAGADVMLLGDEHVYRMHTGESLKDTVVALSRIYDFILVEGHASTPVPKVWLLTEGHERPPQHCGEVLKVCSRQQAEAPEFFSWLVQFLTERWMKTPVWGCVLIGGKSSRMGWPKHLIKSGDETWIEHTVARLRPHVGGIALSGRGSIPKTLNDVIRIPDIPGLAGPLAGILAIQRWLPAVSWIVVACDQPEIQADALTWLLENRRPGVRVLFPDLKGTGKVEPLLAYYDLRCRHKLEQLAASGSLKISNLASIDGAIVVQPPVDLHLSWLNINTREELRAFSSKDNPTDRSG